MSKETISEILAKAITNKQYRELLFSSPDEALAGSNLTEQEAKALKGIDRITFEMAATELEERVLKTGGDPGRIDAILIQCNNVMPTGSFVDALDLSQLYGE